MMSTSGGLKPRAVAGSPSVIRLTHKSCTGIRASGIPRAAVKKIHTTWWLEVGRWVEKEEKKEEEKKEKGE